MASFSLKPNSLNPRHAGLLIWCLLAAMTQSGYCDTPDPERKRELRQLLAHDCGACHGITLKGGLGPALTTDSLRLKPKEYLLQTIREGHPGTPMPPWKNLLADEDIGYLVELLTTLQAENL